jgi:hypothetical protein
VLQIARHRIEAEQRDERRPEPDHDLQEREQRQRRVRDGVRDAGVGALLDRELLAKLGEALVAADARVASGGGLEPDADENGEEAPEEREDPQDDALDAAHALFELAPGDQHDFRRGTHGSPRGVVALFNSLRQPFVPSYDKLPAAIPCQRAGL